MPAADDASKTVKTVEAIDHKAGDQGGGKAAYAELKKEYDQYAGSHSAEDTQKYWDGVTNQLKKNNVLPDLAVAWGAANSDLAQGKSAEDMKVPFKYDFSGATAQYKFDKTFANQLSSQVGDLDNGGGWFFGANRNGKLEQGELNKYLENQSATNQDVADKQDARNDMAPLFKGNPPLISALDNAKGGEPDGYVSSGDMKRFLEDYDKYTNGGKLKAPDGSVYTPENAKYVQELLDGKHPSIVDKGLEEQGGYSDGFNVATLAQNGGFDSKSINNASDYGDVVKNFQALQPAEPQAAKTADTQPAKTTDAANKQVTETDAAGAQITKDGNGNVVDVKYKDGKSRHFDYTDGKMTGMTMEGHSYTSKDGTSFESTYKPKAGETADANLYNVKVDGDGTFHATVKRGEQMVNVKVGTDDVAKLDTAPPEKAADKPADKPADTAATPADAEKQMVADGTAKAGEGYIKVAARMLGKPTANDTDPDVRALYQELEALNQNKKLHVGEQVVTPEMIAKIQNPAFKARMTDMAKQKTADTQDDQQTSTDPDLEQA